MGLDGGSMKAAMLAAMLASMMAAMLASMQVSMVAAMKASMKAAMMASVCVYVGFGVGNDDGNDVCVDDAFSLRLLLQTFSATRNRADRLRGLMLISASLATTGLRVTICMVGARSTPP